jgi:hypothetical protein
MINDINNSGAEVGSRRRHRGQGSWLQSVRFSDGGEPVGGCGHCCGRAGRGGGCGWVKRGGGWVAWERRWKVIVVGVRAVAMGIDMAHTVSISGIFTSIQYNSEIDQDSAVLTIQIFGA